MSSDKKNTNVRAVLFCSLIMLITAASDALRGVFLPQFKSSFRLTDSQSSRIIMMSYVGNLLFLFIGGYLSDRLPRRRFLGGVLALWLSALLTYALTENYPVLLFAMIFSMGGSTMISTSVNILTPLLFASPAMLVNIFNFVQGVGITASQNIGGRFAHSLTYWHIANLILLGLGVVCFIILMTLKLPDPEKTTQSPTESYKSVLRSPASYVLILICGCYFIAEHGLQNWLTSYGSEYLGFTVERSAYYLSLFFGGLTIGRLVFAPLVQKLGVMRSMLIFSALSAVLYTAGILMRSKGMYVLAVSGLAFSIMYPTLVLLIGLYFDKSIAGAATGSILSLGTIFDVVFNGVFGSLVESKGYGSSILVLPGALIVFTVLLYLLRAFIPPENDKEKTAA